MDLIEEEDERILFGCLNMGYIVDIFTKNNTIKMDLKLFLKQMKYEIEQCIKIQNEMNQGVPQNRWFRMSIL